MTVTALQRLCDVPCDCCTDLLDVTACPICSLRLCARCWVVHMADRHERGDSSICLAVVFVAECHARERGSNEPSDDDFSAARADLVAYVRVRRVH